MHSRRGWAMENLQRGLTLFCEAWGWKQRAAAAA